MKKRFLLPLLFLSMIFPFFADAKNLVYTNSFDFYTIDNLEITLTYEQLQILRIYGNELLVEIGSNNIKKIPEVSCDQETLKITSKEEKYKRGDKCTVYLYIPQDFQAQSITIRNVSGNISADFLKAQNAVLLSNVSGRTDIGSCQTELFTCLSVSGNTSLQKIMVDYFEFGSTSGNIFAELERAPLATSMISNISGKTQVYFPKNSNFEILAFTISGSIKIPDSQNQKNTPHNFHSIIGDGGTSLSVTSVSGKIEFTQY